MKQVKKILYLIGVLAVLGLTILAGTAIAQVGMELIAQSLGTVVPEELLYRVSGSCGIAIAVIVCTIFVRKKKYAQCIEKKEPFRVKTLLYYGALSICICQILIYAVTTLLFAQVFPIAESQQLSMENTFVDVAFAILVAPIFEELLFRMGLYTLLCRKFSRVSSVVLCAIIFALVHGYSLQGFLACLSAGVVFTLIYACTGNVWYSIMAHMFCNLEAAILNWLEAKGAVWMGIPVQYEVNGYNMEHPIFIVIAVVFCIICIIRAKKNKIDMVLTDIMMPHVDGYHLVDRIRQVSNVPILFLSAKTDVIDRVKGLQLGADDYILKPFDPLEVATRVSANLRRCYGYGMQECAEELCCGNLKLDVNKCLLRKGEQIVELTALEYRMLQYFMENQGRVLTKNQIYTAAWEENQFPDDNSIMVAISKLRGKLQDEQYEYIHTIRGLGYRMEAR